MRLLKKWIAVLLCALLIFGAAAPVAVFAQSAAQERPHYFLLGDSIAEGFGVKNPSEASYGKIVANTNGYEYANVGFAGCTSEDLLYRVQNNSRYRDYIAWADIISISVGGNDFLLDNAVLLLAEGILFHRYQRFDKIRETYYKNFSACLEEIHAINPDAVLLVQTLYNGWNNPAVANTFQQAADRVNAAIFALHEENPDSFYIVDTREAMSFHKELISSDTIHPNAEGNVVLARLVLEKLYEIGLGQTTEPVIVTPGISRDYLNEYFVFPLGPVITFLANWATGNL